MAISEIRESLAPYDSFPMHELLERTALRLPYKTAIIDDGNLMSYKNLYDYSCSFATALIDQGLQKGDRVAILSPNCAEFIIAFYGIVATGGVVTTINSGYKEREISHQIASSKCETVIVHHTLSSVLKKAIEISGKQVETITIGPNNSDSDEFWNLASNNKPLVDVDIEPINDLAAMPYSSGTTGLSKGVMLTHFNLVSNVQQLLGLSGICKMKENDMVLVHLPLFHIYGMNILMNGCIATGATQVMMGRFDMGDFLDLIEKYRVTKLFTVPPIGLGLTQTTAIKGKDLSCLELAFFGAAPLSSGLQEKIQNALGCSVIQGYGMTETSPLANSDFSESILRKSGSVGPAVADTEEKIVDVENPDKTLPFGEPGELMIRGPQVMKGYFNDDEATLETLTKDGWIHTGDIARMDPEGYVWILDRKKELIKYKGFQVPPADLEGVLQEHPDILDAAVIGKPDEESGEIPKAFVVKIPDSGLTENDIIDFIADKVATFKQIREVEFTDSIPRNPSGKILRRLLRYRSGAN